MLLRRIRHGQILLLLCASCHLTMAFPTQTPPAYDEEQHLRVSIPSSGQIFAPLGSSITIPCLVSLSSIPSSSSAPPVVPRVKWSVISGRVEKQILVARGKRVKVSEAYRDRAALLNYTSFPDDMSLWLGDLRSSDSAHYRCEVQQGLEDASDLVQLKVKGVVFHYRDALGRYAFSFHQAQRACEAIGAQIATADQLLAAYYDGYEQCDAGWLTDQSVRYPIQVPREGCYGDMDGQPGVRNYGTMNPDDLFDVYCYVEQIDGEVFHDSIPQHLSFDEAQSYCRAARAELATTAQLYLAWSEGLDHCSPGWLSDGSVRYPIITPRERCGGPQAGVKTLYRFSNQTGFPEPSSLHDVYCFKENRNTSTDSPMDYMGKEPEDVGHNFIILMEKDQEIQLNQQVEQVEREAQSVLESLPFFSRPFTEENLVDTQPTVVSSTTESPLTTMSTLHDPFDKTLSTTKMSYNSQDPTAMVNSNFTETYNSPQNTSFLPNDTDSHQNLSFTFHQSELIRTTFEPETQNQTEPYTNTEEKTEPSEKLKDTKETQETNLNFNKSETSFSETDSNYTQETSFLEVTTSTPGPMVQVKVEKTGAESPVQIFLTTEASKEEGKLFTELAQITQSTMEALTSLWAHSDGSGDSSQESSLDTGPVSFISTSDSSISGFTTRPSLTASASSTPPEPPTTASHLTPLSQSRLSDKLGLDIPSTESQLWESSISKQEGSTSLEIEDTLSMENEEKMVPTTKAEDLQESGVSSAITQSPEGSNTSRSPTSSSIAQYQTSGYRVYLDSVTSAYEEASGHELDTVIGTLREVIKFAPTPDSEVTQNLKEMANNSFSLEKEIKIAPTFALDKESNISFNLEEENNVSPTLVFEKANISSASESVAPTLWFEDKGNVSLTLEDEVDVPPTVTLDKDINEPYISPNVNFEENANASSAHERNVVPTFVYEEKANISVTLEEEIDVSPIAVLEEEVNITSTSEEQTSVAPTLEKEANLSPNISSEEKTNTSSTLEGETQIIVTEEETSVSSTQEEEANVSPTLLFEEEAKVIPTHVFEKQATVSSAQHTYVSPTLEEKTDADQSFEDFTIFPLNSQTSKWDLLTTTTGPQESLNDLEYSRKPSSTAASASSHATKPTKTTTVSTTTHWSRRTWSPTTTAPKVFHEPKKVTHFIPPVDHSLGDVEISLTQPPTLLILPNERAAVGSRGKSSDSCLNDPCLNGGTCTDRGGQIECLCLPTYGGDFCQTDLERCEPGWDKFHGFCYRHFSQRLSWEVAEQQCRMMGAHLVSIMTPEEQSYINSNYKEYQWTGLNDKTVEDDFRWSDGNPLLYENWYRGQPDSYFLSGEDCVVMVWHDNGRWSDVPCNYHLAYTCKKGTSSCGPPPKVRNASIYGKARQRYETNAVVRYHCAEGFQQRLNPLIRCLSGGFWERPQILCMHEAGGPLSLTDSNFAAAEDDFEATDETPQYWDIKF